MLARRKKQLASCIARQDLTISVLLKFVLLLRVSSSVQNWLEHYHDFLQPRLYRGSEPNNLKLIAAGVGS